VYRRGPRRVHQCQVDVFGAAAAAPLSVADAEAQGLVSASWVGNGSSSGDAIRLAVTSAAPAPLLLDVLTGTARARRPPVSPSTRRADAGGAGLA